MKRRRAGRLTGGLLLTAAAGILWLAGRGWPLPRLHLRELISQEALAQALLDQELPLAADPPEPDRLLLDQLPAVEQLPQPQPEQPAPPEPEQASAPPEPEFVPISGALEAPEQEPEPEPSEQPPEIPPIDVDPDALELTNSTEHIELELGDYLNRDLPLTLSKEGPQILIMHTHGTEAYTIADGDDYTPSDTARTTDQDYNMIRVGEEMKAVFEDMGLGVVHDTSLYDYPGYNGSYARSLKGIQSYLEEYPTIDLVLDVHRDALIAADGTVYKKTDVVDDETVAQVMLVVGTNDGGLDHPNWQDNLTLAAQIQARMLGIHSTFPRPVNLRSQRFNQHMTSGSLLVEVGTSGNTLQEALAGARLFARAAGTVYLTCMAE